MPNDKKFPSDEGTLTKIYDFICDLWERGAVNVKVGDVEVEFGEREFAAPAELDENPLPKTEPGYSFFFEGEFSGLARVNMSDQEAGYVRDMIREDAVEIVEKYLKRVRYGG